MKLDHPVHSKVFHTVLMACLSEQRGPTDDEVELMASKIWHDSHGSLTGQHWWDVRQGSDAHRQMISAARMAFGFHEPQVA